MNKLQKKLGPLKLWQWLAVGGAAGVGLYLYRKAHEGPAAKEVNPEEEEKLLGALRNSGGGGGAESGGGAGVAAPGPVGLTGEAGSPGGQGPQGESVNLAPIEASISNLEHQLATNNPPTVSHNAGAQKKAANDFTHVNPATGQHYKIVSDHGRTVHVYHDGHRVTMAANKRPTGHAQKPKAAKRPKPTPIHHRVSAHHVAPHRAAPKPVHHPAPVHKPAKRKRR